MLAEGVGCALSWRARQLYFYGCCFLNAPHKLFYTTAYHTYAGYHLQIVSARLTQILAVLLDGTLWKRQLRATDRGEDLPETRFSVSALAPPMVTNTSVIHTRSRNPHLLRANNMLALDRETLPYNLCFLNLFPLLSILISATQLHNITMVMLFLTCLLLCRNSIDVPSVQANILFHQIHILIWSQTKVHLLIV